MWKKGTGYKESIECTEDKGKRLDSEEGKINCEGLA